MIGVEFGPPKSLRLKASWNVLETASKGLFLPAHHGAAVQGSQDPDPGLRPRQPHRQAAAARDHHARGLQLDRDGLRFRDRLQPQGSRRDLVAGQDAGRQRGAEVGVDLRALRRPPLVQGNSPRDEYGQSLTRGTSPAEHQGRRGRTIGSSSTVTVIPQRWRTTGAALTGAEPS